MTVKEHFCCDGGCGAIVAKTETLQLKPEGWWYVIPPSKGTRMHFCSMDCLQKLTQLGLNA